MKAFFISYLLGDIQQVLRRTISLTLLFSTLSVNTLNSEPPPIVLAFGDSLTAGFGVAEQESYPSRLQKILTQHGHPHQVTNAGVSGDTTAGGLSRIDWLLKQNPKIVIVELGANDGLRGLPLSKMYANLDQIIRRCRQAGARVLLAGMKIPPNYGDEYTQEFEDMFHRLAEQYQLNFIPFFLEGVAAKREYTMEDGIHPLAPGYKIVTETVWRALEPML
ncbi:MAG: arylesterase [Nitrospinota bacterium]|nr:arylesterase [Nitrospinota bacterium]